MLAHTGVLGESILDLCAGVCVSVCALPFTSCSLVGLKRFLELKRELKRKLKRKFKRKLGREL